MLQRDREYAERIICSRYKKISEQLLEPVLDIFEVAGGQPVLFLSRLNPGRLPGSDVQCLPSPQYVECTFRVKLGTKHVVPVAKSLVWKNVPSGQQCCTFRDFKSPAVKLHREKIVGHKLPFVISCLDLV